jgi:hypothetical protein
MKPFFEKIAGETVHGAVPLQAAHRCEGIGNDPHPQMSFAGTIMMPVAGMKMAFVDDLEALRRKPVAKAL